MAQAVTTRHLVLAGGETLVDDRDYRIAFERRAHERGVSPGLLGVVDDDELPALVAEASALAFVSTKEGLDPAPRQALAAAHTWDGAARAHLAFCATLTP